MKKFKFFIVLTCIWSWHVSNAQNCEGICCGTIPLDSNSIETYNGEREMDCGKNSSDWINFYRLQDSYIPNTNSIEAEKIIPINIVVFGEDDGSGYAITAQEFEDDYITLSTWLNEVFATPTNTTFSPICPAFLPDSKIRFVLKAIYHYPNSILHNINTGSQKSHDNLLMDHHLAAHPECAFEVNCFLIKFHKAAAGWAQINDQHGHTIPYVSTGTTKIENGQEVNHYDDYSYFGNHLPHELGHILSLKHTRNSETLNPADIDFLCDVFEDPPVYFYSDNIMGETENDNFISPKQMGRGHRSLSTDFETLLPYTIRHFAYGYSDQPRVIETDQTWDFTFKSYNDIVIKKGATLTLTCRLEMVPQASIIVERGGTLIVDGATITSARCGGPEHEGLWQGIQVWGNPDYHQLAVDGDNVSYHGKVIIKNEALIENARIAVQAWRPSTWDHGGGIVQIEESTFRNNSKGIHFGQYTKSDSQSKVINSTFETTQNLMSQALPQTFIEGWAIKGIRIYSNIFRNTNPDVVDFNHLGKGIYLESARALISGQITGNVTDFCDENNQNWKPNYFENLFVGVELINFGMQQTNGIYTSVVNRNVFKNCILGVQSKGMPAVRIEQNKVTTGSNDFWLWNEGITHRSYTGFSITENCVEVLENNVPVTGGILVADVSGDNNDVYKNYSHNLDYAFVSNGKNKTAAPSSSQRFRGLQYLCNENNGTQRFDFSVVAQDPNDPMSGIRYYQGGNGSSTSPNSAANLFTNSCLSPEGDFYNNTINPIVYFFDQNVPLQEPLCYSWNFTPANSLVSDNLCPSRVPSNSGGGVPHKSLLTAEFAIRNSQFIVVSTLYHNLLDNGNTDALLQSINSSYSNDPVGLKNILLNNSPNLSDELIRELISEYTILSNNDLLQIVASNPDVAHNEELLKILSEKANPMDSWMIEFLRNAGSYTTDRTELEKVFSQKQYERDEIVWELVRFILTDTTDENYNFTELHDWLNIIGSPRAKYLIADDYCSRANFSEALNVLNSMNTENLDRFELIEHTAVIDWIQFQEQLALNNKTLWNLDSTDISNLSMFADNMESNGIVGVFAANVINHYFPESYPMEYLYPNINKSQLDSRKPRMLKKLDNNEALELILYPNPVEEQLNIIIDKFEKADKITIFDTKGNAVKSYKINKEKHVSIMLPNLASGTYLVSLSDVAGNELQNGRFIVK